MIFHISGMKMFKPSVNEEWISSLCLDESQLGGLCSLMAAPPNTPTTMISTMAPLPYCVPKPPKKRYLENYLDTGQVLILLKLYLSV